MSEDKRKITKRQRVFGIGRVAKITFLASPFAVFVKLFGALVSSLLPLATAFYAALTTTALAEAYVGNDGAGSQAITYVIITALLGVALTAWGSLEQYINQFVQYKIDAAINDKLFEQFLSLEFWRYDDKRTIDLLDKSRQFAQFFGSVFDKLMRLLESFITFVAAFIALLFVSWWLGLILLVAVIPGAIIQFKLSREQTRHWNGNVETRRVRNMLEWDMSQVNRISEFRIYGMTKHLLAMRRRLRDKDEKEQIEFERKFIFKQLCADALEAAAEVAALVYTAIQIIAHTQPIGQFIYVQQVVSRALGGSRGLLSGLSDVDTDIANLFDYNEFMELPVASKGSVRLKMSPRYIKFNNVSFKYPESKNLAINNVTLTIPKNAHVAIVGENGAGKTTFIKLLLGLYRPSSGTIKLDDDDLSDIRTEDWHKQLGVLQQDFGGYAFANARDNILLGDVQSPYNAARFEQAMERSESKKFLNKLPKGLDTYVNQWVEHDDGTSGVDLSGGQWQRLALARNFYRDSPIIILDEPTSAIDALAEARIFKNLLEDKEKTIITISHRLTTIEKADIIYMFEQGRIIEFGTHKELVAKRGAYFTMFQSQLRDAN